MNGKLTKAQRRFLEDTINMGTLGFSADVLRGPETVMCQRLHTAGLLEKTFIPFVREWHWQITDLGRAALKQGEPM